MSNPIIDLSDSDDEFLPVSIPLVRCSNNILEFDSNLLAFISGTTENLSLTNPIIERNELFVSRRLVNDPTFHNNIDLNIDDTPPPLVTSSSDDNNDNEDEIVDVTDQYQPPIIPEPLNTLISDWLTEEQLTINRRNAFEASQRLYRQTYRSRQIRT